MAEVLSEETEVGGRISTASLNRDHVFLCVDLPLLHLIGDVILLGWQGAKPHRWLVRRRMRFSRRILPLMWFNSFGRSVSGQTILSVSTSTLLRRPYWTTTSMTPISGKKPLSLPPWSPVEEEGAVLNLQYILLILLLLLLDQLTELHHQISVHWYGLVLYDFKIATLIFAQIFIFKLWLWKIPFLINLHLLLGFFLQTISKWNQWKIKIWTNVMLFWVGAVLLTQVTTISNYRFL